MFAAVALGAFGAHALRGQLDAQMTAVWQSAVQYHAWHALALLALGGLLARWPERRGLARAGWLFVGGIVLFSGSLYGVALTGVRGLGMITPFGGTAFLVGWGFLVCSAWKLP